MKSEVAARSPVSSSVSLLLRLRLLLRLDEDVDEDELLFEAERDVDDELCEDGA